MSLFVWTLVPLALSHLWMFRRHRTVFRFQLLLDLILSATLGPALLVGGDLNPVRCLERLPPMTEVRWSETTVFQPTQSDLVLQFHPWWEATRERIAAGKLPSIEPGAGGGLPLLANGQTGLWAPVMLPVWLHGPERGTTIMAFWKVELAGLGAFLLFFRVWRLRWTAAAAGGIAWAGTPYLIGWLLVPLAWVVAALPWIWWLALHTMRARSGRRTIAGTGLLFGWLMGSGLHPETAAIVCGSGLLVCFFAHPRRWVRLLAVVLIAGGTALALSWPTVGLIGASSRHALVSERQGNIERPAGSIQRDLTIQMILPASMGRPGHDDWRAPYPHAPGATGVGGVVLALLALGVIRRRYARIVWAAAASTALGLILLIRVPPLDALLVRIPPLDQMSIVRFGALIPWGLVVLAALSLDGALRGRSRTPAWRLVPAVVIGAVALASAPWHLEAMNFSLVLLSIVMASGVALLRNYGSVPFLVAIELSCLAIGINPVADPADRLPTTPLIERLIELEHRGEPYRIIGFDRALPPNLAMRYGLRDLRASDPLRPWPFARLMGVFGEPETILGGALREAPPGLCGAWGVGFAVTRPRRRLEGWDEVYSGKDGRIWSNPRVLPEVRVVGETVVEPEDRREVLEVSEDLDFSRTALVPAGAPPVAATGTGLEIDIRTPSRLEAMVECDGPCLLVLAQPWAPGWRAEVDDEPAELVLTDVAGLGVVVPAGRRRVELSYHPWGW